jgi:hypothetical protein
MNFTLCRTRPWIDFVILILSLGFLSTSTGCGAAYMGQAKNQTPERTLLSVAITPQTREIALGTTLQFSATAVFSDGSKSDVTKTASWISGQPKVATIDAAGIDSHQQSDR